MFKLFSIQMVYGPEKLNDHLNDQLSETPKLSAAIKVIKQETWEYFNDTHELISNHFLNKLKNNPNMAKKILDIINWLPLQYLTPELKELKNRIIKMLKENNWNNTHNIKK